MSRWTDNEIEYLQEHYPTSNTEEIADELGRSKKSVIHKARRTDLTKVDNFEILESLRDIETRTFENIDENFAHFVCGFTAGEGSFCISQRDDRRDKLTFQISLASVDSEILYEIQEFFGAGNIHTWDAREDEWDSEIQFIVQKTGELANIIIPFFERFELQNTNKRRQYNKWKHHFYSEYDIPQEYQF